MPTLPPTLLAAALDHLLRYSLSGCAQSGHHAAYLLDRLALETGPSTELGALCVRMSETLADAPAAPAAA